MQTLTQGANVAIPALSLALEVSWSPAKIPGAEVDVSAFMLTAQGKVRTDDDFVFYNHTLSPCGALRLTPQESSARFDLDLARLPAEIEKVAFVVTLDGQVCFGAAQSVHLTIPGVARFEMNTAGMTEAALILGEVYKRNGAWKVRAVGQGFNGGLAPLATHFGVDVASDAPAPASAAPIPAPPVSVPPPFVPPPLSPPPFVPPVNLPIPPPSLTPAPPPFVPPKAAPPPSPIPVAPPVAPATPPAATAAMSKITLDKRGSSAKISLQKTSGEIIINLNWTQPRGFFSRNVDLDLGIFYELREGFKGLLDGLQFAHGRGGPRDQLTRQGCFVDFPWVWHQGDDRTGAVSTGENIFINPQGIRHLHRVVVYASIYEGTPRWSTTDAVVKIKVPNQEISVELGKQEDSRRFCVLAELKFSGDSEINVIKHVTFHQDAVDCDRNYQWNLKYTSGSK